MTRRESGPGFELKDLARQPVPPPRRDAMEAAKRTAMQNFDAALKNSSAQAKGRAGSSRLHRIATSLWSLPMNMRLLSGTAIASLFVLPVAGLVAFQMSDNVFRREPAGGLITEHKVAVVEQESAKLAKAKKDSSKPSDMSVADLTPVKPAPAAAPAATTSAVADAEADAAMPVKQFRSRQMAMQEAPQGYLNAEPPRTDTQGVNESRDKYPEAKSNSVVQTAIQPVSTFSVDVDTSGYSSLRRMLNQGVTPDAETVRVEELVNYFPYGYAGPEKSEDAFKANVTVTPTPWSTHTKLMHIGIKGYDLPVIEQKSANLVFLLDVSGSMDEPNKLPLVKASFRLLVNTLKPTDTISIVTYAGESGVVLEPTKVSEAKKILAAIDNLQPGGSTAGEAGINAAYALAERVFVKDGVNRIMLATDGDFNVGAASEEDLKKLVEQKRKSGVFLSVLGFGDGNYQDNLMQTLAQNGNGIAAYIDTLGEAEKVLVQEATSSLFAIAKDVKIQVEFNPSRVAEYRLIGYETRHLENEDFNNDKIDAGDIGSGHTVTAIYEVTPIGSPAQINDSLRYQTNNAEPSSGPSGEYGFVKIRYKLPNEDKSRLVTQPVTDANAVAALDGASEDVRFGIAVAAFGQKLRNESQVADYAATEIEKLANGAKGTDVFGYRAEFIKLVRLAAALEK